jgi:ribosomal protein S18 acetylase RimI-like enzyme
MSDFEFRRVQPPDVAFCWTIYREAMQPLTAELMQWNEDAQRRGIEATLGDDDASILISDDTDAGWLHVVETRRDIHLGHLYLAPQARNHGLGTTFLRWMGERARRKDKNFTLEVLKNNRARRLYERLGFRIIETSPLKHTMQFSDG